MREIKFKVWCKNKKEWEKDNCFITKNGSLYQQSKQHERLVPTLEKNHSVVQFTGLKDKNGVEIYEGDIVRAKLINVLDFIIVFEKGRFTMKMILGSGTGADDQRWILNEDCEVVGNIYENPDLLEVQNG